MSKDVRKPFLKATFKDTTNLINNNNFLVDEPENVEPATPCMDVYKANIQYIVSLDKSKLIIMVRGYLKNMSTFKYFLSDSAKHKKIVH